MPIKIDGDYPEKVFESKDDIWEVVDLLIETGTPAYPGSYGEQPANWIRHFFLIKNALAKQEKKMHEDMRRKAKIGK